MRTLLGFALLLAATLLVALGCPDLADAATCQCAVTGRCTCPPGACECPNCPGNVHRVSHPHGTLYVFLRQPAPAVAAVPPPVVYYRQPAATPSSGGCYQDAYGHWICPQQQSGYVFRRKDFTAGERRRMRRAQRDGWIFFE